MMITGEETNGIAPQYVGLYIQRSCARQQPIPPNLEKRLDEMADFADDADFARVLVMSEEELQDYCRKVL